MTPLAQGAAGLAVALGFALLSTRRTGGLAILCVAQAVVVALAALAQGEFAVALVACAEAALVGWLGTRILPLPLWVRSAARPNHPGAGASVPYSPPAAGGIWLLGAGAVLAGLAATIPGTGLALAVVLLGLLLLAARPLPSHQALGIAAVQNGLVLAGIAAGLSNGRLALVVLPWLPALALGALWLGSDRARTAWLQAPRPAGWIDTALCGLALVLAAALPWQLGAHGPFWRLDPLAVHVVLLLAALATAASWTQRNASPVWGSRLAILAGTALAVLSTDPLPRWLGMTVATIGVAAAALPARAEAWRRLRLGCTGLGLALFGTIALYAAALPQPASAIALHPAPALLPASVCIMLGYGTLAVLAPELTVAAVALILRMRGAPADDLLLALGLAAMLVATLGLATARGPQRRTLPLVGLAQGGAAVFAFGLGSESGNLAGLLQLSFLALTQCALLLARENGLDRLAARAGLAGLPPFGLFPSLALILVATAERLPWLLLPLGAGLAAVAWAVLLQLPAGHRLRLSPAWLPLALLLIAGFAMPDPLLAWFRLAAR
ncbi:MAG: hypothetical protein ABSC95_11615 [Acetobacteraceae bacterium]|jgi:hydrogenase-4 component F